MLLDGADVVEITGYLPSDSLVQQAQMIIETYVGRAEAEVENAKDREHMKKATAYQASYMQNGTSIVYEQAAVTQTGTAQGLTTFKNNDFTAPWIAPLAVIECSHLSWAGSRSIHTGPMWKRLQLRSWWTD